MVLELVEVEELPPVFAAEEVRLEMSSRFKVEGNEKFIAGDYPRLVSARGVVLEESKGGKSRAGGRRRSIVRCDSAHQQEDGSVVLMRMCVGIDSDKCSAII